MIIMCEPYHAGIMHTEVNAGLIAVAARAYPAAEILFLGDADHLAAVSKKVAGPGINRVRYQAIELPGELLSVPKRTYQEFKCLKQIFAIARHHRQKRIFFLAISTYGLFWLKVLLRFYREISCLAVPHSPLETIRQRPRKWHLGIPFWFCYTLTWGNGQRLRFLLLGPSIEQELLRELPGLRPYVCAIDHPLPLVAGDDIVPPAGNCLTFGYLGTARPQKGGDQFLRLVSEVKARQTGYEAEFVLIGYIRDEERSPLLTTGFGAPAQPLLLPRDQYDELARGIDYAVFLHEPAAYTLTAAGTLFDAFAFLKPVIALRNPFMDYYFQELGDIGYLCDTYAELCNTVLALLENFPRDRYLTQCRNILQGRLRFATGALAGQFKAIWEQLDQTG